MTGAGNGDRTHVRFLGRPERNSLRVGLWRPQVPEQALEGFVSLPLAMTILIGSSIGSQLGALTTHHLPNRILRLIFGCLVAATVVMILWDLSSSLVRHA